MFWWDESIRKVAHEQHTDFIKSRYVEEACPSQSGGVTVCFCAFYGNKQLCGSTETGEKAPQVKAFVPWVETYIHETRHVKLHRWKIQCQDIVFFFSGVFKFLVQAQLFEMLARQLSTCLYMPNMFSIKRNKSSWRNFQELSLLIFHFNDQPKRIWFGNFPRIYPEKRSCWAVLIRKQPLQSWTWQPVKCFQNKPQKRRKVVEGTKKK